MQKKLFAALLGVALVMPLAAQAEGSYFKVGVGGSEYDFGGFKKNKTAVSLAYGFAVDKNFGVELGYLNFGKQRWVVGDSSSSLQNQSVYLAGVGSLPLTDAFSIYGKLGVALNHTKAAESNPVERSSGSETEAKPLVGLGLSYNFTKDIAGTLEYHHVGKVSDTDLKMSVATLGIKYGF
jgi:OOP family OmpA-OmpF porin